MLRVATLNQYQPGLSSDDLSDVGQLVDGGKGGSKANVWEALRGWGQRLDRKADIVFLQEVRNGSHVRYLAQPDISGLPYYALMQENFYTDCAILSRYPLSNVQRFSMEKSNTLCATATIEGVPHLLFSVHWAGKGQLTSASVRKAARWLIEFIREANMPAIVGGDLNFMSGYGLGPERRSETNGILGSAPAEYIILSSFFNDVYTSILPTPPYGSDARIDYILFKGDYTPVEYNAVLDASPSDHPFVIASLRPMWVNQPRITSHAPVTAVSPRMDELLVTGITDESIENGRLMYANWTPSTSGWRGWNSVELGSWNSIEFPHDPPESFIRSAAVDGRAYVFWIGQDGWVYYKSVLPDGRWSIALPAGGSNSPGSNGLPGGAVHVVSCQPGTLHMFYTNRQGRILVACQDIAAGGMWPKHGGLRQGMTRPGGHVTAVSCHPGQIDVFTVGIDGRVYTASWNSHDNWKGWLSIEGLVARPGTYVGAVSRSTDQLDIFVADINGRIMSAAWTPGTGWHGWWHIQGGRTGSDGYVTAVSRSIDKLDIFTIGLDWGIRTAAWAPETGWKGWWTINNAKSKSPIWPVTRSKDKLDIFFVDLDGTIRTAAWEPGRTRWGGPWTISQGWDSTHLPSLAAPGLITADIWRRAVLLNWKDNNPDTISFKIERKSESTSSYIQIAEVGSRYDFYIDKGLNEGTNYTYRMKATTQRGDTAYSNEISVTPKAKAGSELITLRHNNVLSYDYEAYLNDPLTSPNNITPDAVVTGVKNSDGKKMILRHEGFQYLFNPENDSDDITDAFNGSLFKGKWLASIKSSLPTWHLNASISIEIDWEYIL